MPLIHEWLSGELIELPWEQEQVAYHYDSQPGFPFFTFPMTGLLPINIVKESDLLNAPTPLWITYLEPEDGIGTLDTKGDKTFRFALPESFEVYIEGLSYDNRKEMRYCLRKNADLTVLHDQKSDLFNICDQYFSEINQRCLAEGENPFSAVGIDILKRIYATDRCKTSSIYFHNQLLGVNVSFERSGIIYDSCFMKTPLALAHKKRSLGTFAILTNIERAITQQYRVYDMLVGEWGYKTKFGAVAVPMRSIIRGSKEFAEGYGISLAEAEIV